MSKFLKGFLALTLALPASALAEASRVEKIEKDTQAERAENKKELAADILEAEGKLNELNQSLESLKSFQTTHKRAAIFGAAASSTTAALGIILTLKIEKGNTAARYAFSSIFGILTALNAASTAENLHEARLDLGKIEDMQTQIFSAKRRLAELKEQLNLDKGSAL